MGLRVTNTGISLTDQGGGTFVDGSGVIGTHTFNNFSTLYLPDLPDISDTVFTDIGSATMNIVTNRTSPVLMLLTSYGNQGVGVSQGTIRMVLGGTNQSAEMIYSNVVATRSSFNIANVSSGTTVFKLQGAVASGTNTIQHGGGYVWMGYLVLGR